MRFEEINSLIDVKVGDIVRIKPKVVPDITHVFGATKDTDVMIELFYVRKLLLDSAYSVRIKLINNMHPHLARSEVDFKPEELFVIKRH